MSVTNEEIEFGWFIPTSGDGPYIGVPPEREATLDYMIDVAQAAEAAGFTFALIPTGSTCIDGWVLAGAIVARTKTFKPLVAMRPGFISPVLAARMAGSLDYISNGRALINVVTGDSAIDLKAMGDPLHDNHDARYDRTLEFVQVVKNVWEKSIDNGKNYFAGDRVKFEGEYYQVESVASYPAPVQRPHPPLYFGGSSPAGKRVASKVADVYLMWAEPLEWIKEQIQEMEDLRRVESERTGQARAIRYGLRAQVLVRETAEEAWQAARNIVSRADPASYAMAKSYHNKTDATNQKRQNQLRDMSEQTDGIVGPNLWAGLSAIRGGGALMFVGTPDEVADRLIEFVDIGISAFILSSYPHLEEVTTTGQLLLPVFEDKIRQRAARVSGSLR
ncbi:LLM class flavin-dependent oxidoreductase [Alicyclobacillus acidiphilus]|uniref:LLM class flavin-dependent oxidoreductase n=1 Tax=Alicyclobacillus acidiphilus TaxID=182455 RepID=UPI00083015A4|nr:LLM class flavin-dependent oxidoreductase [Alicyclobacillus acidiphilus]